MNYEIQARVKSFGWRLGSMVVVAILAFLAENATDLQIPAWGVVVIGLVSAEITKYLNNGRR